jgi:hypothetical protein
MPHAWRQQSRHCSPSGASAGWLRAGAVEAYLVVFYVSLCALDSGYANATATGVWCTLAVSRVCPIHYYVTLHAAASAVAGTRTLQRGWVSWPSSWGSTPTGQQDWSAGGQVRAVVQCQMMLKVQHSLELAKCCCTVPV